MSDIKTITCPKCGNTECCDTDDYCWNCGTILGNCCENPECPEADTNKSLRGFVDLPDQYCYCPYCGKESRYYKFGVLKPIDFQS